MNTTDELRRMLMSSGIEFECGYQTECGTVSSDVATRVMVGGREIDIEGSGELVVFGLSPTQIVRAIVWAKRGGS